MSKIKDFLGSKKFKYGSLSIVFIAVFVAFVIAFNLVITWLDSEYNLKIDLTDNSIYSVSEEVDEALRSALGDKYESFNIKITFCSEKDMFDYYDSYNTSVTSYYSMIRDLAEELGRIYDGNGKGNITVEYINITRDPEAANRIKQQARLDTLTWNNIIIQNASDFNYFRVRTFDSFYWTDEDTGELFASYAEACFSSSIIQCVLADNMTVAFTEGHGETHSDSFVRILESAPLNVITIDLKKSIPDEVSIIVVDAPLYDFTYEEITALSDFMSDKQTYNSVMVFVNAETPDLPNLRDYLWEQWGLDYLPNNKVTDTENSLKGSDGSAVIGKYSSADTGIANALVKTASAGGVSTVFKNAVALNIDNTSSRSNTVSGAVYANQSAVINVGETEKQAGSDTPLLAISTVHSYDNTGVNYNANKYEYVMLCGSTDFVSDDFLKNSYGNLDIITAATRAFVTDRVALDFDYKTFNESPLDLTTGDAKRLTILVVCAVPLTIIIVGIAVFLKRRHL